ncbi:ABC transporter permease [Massilimicrobiota timonensis]|uniref:ABC transporter permease n=1 Tax=Massilimicrobiota timonensis TaxID=1776392 RepID=A0ABT7UEZ8_9FIRM|nr:ABC transporter permease [Massilimicrobiota timonensis]MDM8194725.1 ABC transporter permease [Massilimicrobiota timonensis]
MIIFASRVLKIYLRDKTAVFFSLLSSFIIIGLYILFLGETYSSSFEQIGNIHQLMDQWVMAGLLATTSVSTSVATLSVMVDDQYQKRQKDFYCTPIKKTALAGGYFMASLIISFFLSLITLFFAQIYILINKGSWFSFSVYMQIIVILLLTVLMNSSMMFFISSFFKSNHAFSTATSIIGTLIGFLTGIYIPIGTLPEIIQWVIKIFPTSHGAVLLRQTMMNSTMNQSFQQLPQTAVVEFQNILGITYQFENITLTPMCHYFYLIIFTIIFFIGAVYIHSRQRQ